MTQVELKPCPVLQCDREAAARLDDWGDESDCCDYESKRWERLRAGELDNWTMVQAFARHRVENTRPADPSLAPLREAVAFALWKAEADRAAPNVGKMRTLEVFRTELNDRNRLAWLSQADAAIAAIAAHKDTPHGSL